MFSAGRLLCCTALLATLGACSNQPGVVINNANPAAGVTTQPQNGSSASAVLVRGAESGKKQKIYFTTFLNPDCSHIPGGLVKEAPAPAHGHFTTEPGEDFPVYQKENIRSACNGKKMPVFDFFYTSEPGFTGSDSFGVDVVGPTGTYVHYNFTINVR